MYFMFRRWTLISSQATSSSTMALKSACTQSGARIFSKATISLQQPFHTASSSVFEQSTMGLSTKEVPSPPSKWLGGNLQSQQSLASSPTRHGIDVSLISDLGTSRNFSN